MANRFFPNYDTYRITSPFGMRTLRGATKMHNGIDLVADANGCGAVDEITAPEDCQALIQASGCGVRLIATAHAAGMTDFRRRSVYSALRESRIFDTFLILEKDKTFHLEEIYP